MIYKHGKHTRDFFGPFYFYCSLVFYILGAFLIKQLLYSRLLDMRFMIIANSAIIVGYLSSHIQRALME